MLDSELNSNETNIDEATGHSAGAAPAPVTPAVPAALFQPPQVVFQPPAPAPAAAPSTGTRDSGAHDSGARDSGPRDSDGKEAEGEPGRSGRRTRGRGRRTRDAAADDSVGNDSADAGSTGTGSASADGEGGEGGTAAAAESANGIADGEEAAGTRRRRRRNTRTRGRAEAADDEAGGQSAADDAEGDDSGTEADADDAGGDAGSSSRRRRRKRRRGSVDSDTSSPDDPPDTVVHVRESHNPADDVRAIKGSTRLEAKKQRRREGRESGRRRPPVITESEFLARRESVERTMVVRQRGDRTQIAVLEDGVLVEHYVNRTTHASYVGNVYLGKVQNVLPSMEAAFVDIGKGRNAVLYAGEVNFDANGLEGQPKRIESALKPGQSVIVQVTKDPVGHKGARLTSQVSLPGRYLVYVPGASMTGISRKLPDTERARLKQILKKVTPEHAGVIVRTAAEGAAEAELDRDITRLAAQWQNIEKKAKTASAPALLYGEPDLTIRVVRDVFNEDFSKLIVSGDEGWEIIDEYVRYVAPHLADRISRWDDPEGENGFGDDVFAAYRIDEQLAKALERKVWLPSGGSLVIDRTEAMTVIDVNTGKFTGQGGNLEETVTRNNLEAAEEIVRQLRLRDVGGIVVIDFIDMVLESNRELVLRRLLECLARDRTKHQVAEVTSLGLVQMTRKRVGAGLLEAFSEPCDCCNGRGVILTLDTSTEQGHRASAGATHRPVPAPPSHATPNGNGNGNGKGSGPADSKQGSANGRRKSNRGDDHDRNARDTDLGTAPHTDADEATGADAARAEASPAAPAAPAAPSAGRKRRSTSAGTAFATAVLVEDTPAVVPVVATVPPVTDPAPAAVSQGGVGVAEAVPADPPARRTRTRSGSAVARVTVVTDAEPTPVPSAESAPVEPAAEPASTELAPTESVEAEPVSAGLAEPAAAEPVPTESVVAEPVSAEPESAEPLAAEPASVESGAAVVVESTEPVEPVAVEPALVEPVAAEPVPAEPASAEAAGLTAAEAAPAGSVESVPAEPVEDESAADQPAAGESGPALEPASDAPAATQALSEDEPPTWA